MRCIRFVSLLSCAAFAVGGSSQELKPGSERPSPQPPQATASTPEPIHLDVAAGMPLKVALDEEVRLRKVGQPVHGRLTEPVYAFDRMVIPAGTEVLGSITGIQDPSKRKRVLAALNTDLSPYRPYTVEFHSLRLADGRELQIQANVSRASAGVLEFVAADANRNSGKIAAGKGLVKKKVAEAREQARQEWKMATDQIHEPGKIHRIERYALQQLPYRPEYIEKGTAFNVDLTQPLEFGVETKSAADMNMLGLEPPAGSRVRAALVTPLSSATSKKGDEVEAVLTQPLIAGDKLFFPEGSRLRGTVLQARAARRLSKNGELRIMFHELVLPNGTVQRVDTNLDGVAVGKGDHLQLDSEGGAQVTPPKGRYLSTGIAVALAAASASPDRDREMHGNAGDAGGSAATGASGFRAVGLIAGTLVHSRAFSTGMGFYGAGMSVYSHFLARGRDVVYPKDMTMVVEVGSRGK